MLKVYYSKHAINTLSYSKESAILNQRGDDFFFKAILNVDFSEKENI